MSIKTLWTLDGVRATTTRSSFPKQTEVVRKTVAELAFPATSLGDAARKIHEVSVAPGHKPVKPGMR